MFPVFTMCLYLFPILTEVKQLNYFVYYIIQMFESIHNSAETPIGDYMNQVKEGSSDQALFNVRTNPSEGSLRIPPTMRKY